MYGIIHTNNRINHYKKLILKYHISYPVVADVPKWNDWFQRDGTSSNLAYPVLIMIYFKGDELEESHPFSHVISLTQC